MIRLVPVVFVGVVLCLAMSIVNSTFVPISKIPFYIGPCFGAVIALASSENMLNKLSFTSALFDNNYQVGFGQVIRLQNKDDI